MRPADWFIKGISYVNERVGRIAALLILPIFGLLLLEVGLRYVAGSPTVWTNELSQLLFGSYALLAGGYLVLHSGHANVDILHAALSPRVRAAVDIATSVLTFIFLLAFLYFGVSMGWESLSRMETSMSAWNPPIWPVKLLIPLSALLLLLQAIAKLIDDIRIATGREPTLPRDASALEDRPAARIEEKEI